MSATGYTPIITYNSGTTTNVPLAANLASGELAINYADGKLFYKNSGGVVTVLAATAGTTSITTLGTVTTGTWNASVITGTYGGTGVNNGSNTITIAGNVTHSGAFTQTFTATANTSVTLPTSGTIISSVTALSGAVTGTPSSSNYLRGDGTWSTIPATSPGGSNTQVQYNSSGSFAGSANFTFNGTTVTMANDASIHGLTVGLGGGAVASNTAVGTAALFSNSTGANSVAVGYVASYYQTGNSNTSLGHQSFQGQSGLSTGTNNTALGKDTLYSNTTGAYNIAVGEAALRTNTTGSNSTVIGYQASYYNTTGGNNTAIGWNALLSNTTASNNTAVGYQASYSNTTGGYNTAIGMQSMYYMTTGGSNVAIGFQALGGNTTSGASFVNNNAVAIGYNALTYGGGGNSVAVGYQAGLNEVNAGGNNVYIGKSAGSTITSGSVDVYLGYQAAASSASASNEIVIGANITGKGNNTGFISPNGGGVYQGNNSTTWSFTSDQRLKKNIVTNTDGLNKISQLTVRNFEYRLPEEVDPELKPTDALNITGVQLGFIAQELQAVLPDCVTTESTGVLGVNIDNVIYHMVNAIKDLNTLVTAQATEIAALKAKVGI